MVNAAVERVREIVDAARARNAKQMRSALAISAVIAALLWQTRWPSLQLGLIILLAGQLGSALMLFFRNRNVASRPDADLLGWFHEEAAFLDRLAVFENVARITGFLILGYGLWVATRNLLVAALLGIVYPATMYFGMTRSKLLRAKAALKAEKEDVERLLAV